METIEDNLTRLVCQITIVTTKFMVTVGWGQVSMKRLMNALQANVTLCVPLAQKFGTSEMELIDDPFAISVSHVADDIVEFFMTECLCSAPGWQRSNLNVKNVGGTSKESSHHLSSLDRGHRTS